MQLGAIVFWILVFLGFGSFIITVYIKKKAPDEDEEGSFNLIMIFGGFFLILPVGFLLTKIIENSYLAVAIAFAGCIGLIYLLLFLVGNRVKKLKREKEEQQRIENEKRKVLYEAQHRKLEEELSRKVGHPVSIKRTPTIKDIEEAD